MQLGVVPILRILHFPGAGPKLCQDISLQVGKVHRTRLNTALGKVVQGCYAWSQAESGQNMSPCRSGLRPGAVAVQRDCGFTEDRVPVPWLNTAPVGGGQPWPWPPHSTPRSLSPQPPVLWDCLRPHWSPALQARPPKEYPRGPYTIKP